MTLFVFSIALLCSTQTSNAQNTLEINAEANTKTKELRKAVKFDSNKMDDVYKAYQEYGISKKRITNTKISSTAERLEKIKTLLNEKMKSILNEEQYATYLEFSKDN